MHLIGARQAQRSAIAVPELKGMEYVDLSRTAIAGSGLTALLDLPNLKSVRLDGVMLTDAERSELVRHPTLIGSLNGDCRGRKAPVLPAHWKWSYHYKTEMSSAVGRGIASMRPVMYAALIGIAMGASCVPGCAREDDLSTKSPRGTQATVSGTVTKTHEPMRRDPSPKRVPLPNFPSGPNRPRPVGVNVYEEDNRYPDYLLCFYDVDEKKYDERYARTWLASALLQIRWTGGNKFPPLSWVAVIIHTRPEHKGADTFEKSRMLGAIFNAAQVFHLDTDLEQLVARTPLDHHPFTEDPTVPTPGEKQSWAIVERHARSHPVSVGN